MDDETRLLLNRERKVELRAAIQNGYDRYRRDPRFHARAHGVFTMMQIGRPRFNMRDAIEMLVCLELLDKWAEGFEL